jgi:hypothetical protein
MMTAFDQDVSTAPSTLTAARTVLRTDAQNVWLREGLAMTTIGVRNKTRSSTTTICVPDTAQYVDAVKASLSYLNSMAIANGLIHRYYPFDYNIPDGLAQPFDPSSYALD